MSDNILELNLTSETLSFSPALGNVPNRGSGSQGDVFLNGVTYLQSINDVTDPSKPVGIHLELGIWIAVPATDNPTEPQTVARMASIPHGTTILAQGTAVTFSGAPDIKPVDITPFLIGQSQATGPIRFPSQTATAAGTARIPQDLTSLITAGSITQAILDDPNTILREHIASQRITQTTAISISTSPDAPLFGGGTDNIAFLNPNANAVQMSAIFWIETVEVTIVVPPIPLGGPPVSLPASEKPTGRPVPMVSLRPPIPIPVPRPITFTFTQIQYSQVVLLNFAGLSWPHVSVATLVPAGAVVPPPGGWA